MNDNTTNLLILIITMMFVAVAFPSGCQEWHDAQQWRATMGAMGR